MASPARSPCVCELGEEHEHPFTGGQFMPVPKGGKMHTCARCGGIFPEYEMQQLEGRWKGERRPWLCSDEGACKQRAGLTVADPAEPATKRPRRDGAKKVQHDV